MCSDGVPGPYVLHFLVHITEALALTLLSLLTLLALLSLALTLVALALTLLSLALTFSEGATTAWLEH